MKKNSKIEEIYIKGLKALDIFYDEQIVRDIEEIPARSKKPNLDSIEREVRYDGIND